MNRGDGEADQAEALADGRRGRWAFFSVAWLAAARAARSEAFRRARAFSFACPLRCNIFCE